MAFQKYRSAPYPQPVLAFHCLDSEKYLHHSKKDWMRAAPHMEMIEMNCLHHEILVDPHVREVARIIERSIALSQTGIRAKTQHSTVTLAKA
jgi:thioesterase domain-containing protein